MLLDAIAAARVRCYKRNTKTTSLALFSSISHAHIPIHNRIRTPPPKRHDAFIVVCLKTASSPHVLTSSLSLFLSPSTYLLCSASSSCVLHPRICVASSPPPHPTLFLSRAPGACSGTCLGALRFARCLCAVSPPDKKGCMCCVCVCAWLCVYVHVIVSWQGLTVTCVVACAVATRFEQQSRTLPSELVSWWGLCPPLYIARRCR